MELCDQNLDEMKNLGVEEATPIIFGIARGLDYSHRRGITSHRDIKPQNILFKNGVSKISDWGLSKVEGMSSSIREFSHLSTAHQSRSVH
jgi:serine/threonine protein kinase